MDKELENSPAPGLLRAETPALAGGPLASAAIQVQDALAIGLDLESADNLPWSDDPWSEPFYVENFTRAELAWCRRQPDPRLAGCGLWSAKEAALKCGQEFAGLRPIDIEILHDPEGRPRPRTRRTGPAARPADWLLSISHAGRMGMAVCMQQPANQGKAPHA